MDISTPPECEVRSRGRARDPLGARAGVVAGACCEETTLCNNARTSANVMCLMHFGFPARPPRDSIRLTRAWALGEVPRVGVCAEPLQAEIGGARSPLRLLEM